MAHLGPTELDADPYPITFSQELLNLARLHIYIMLVCTRTHANLFKRHCLLILACLVFFLCLLILILTVVHQFTDWRHSIGRYLNKIKIAVTANIKRTHRGHHTNHLPVLVDQAYLACTYAFVNPGLTCTVIPPKIPVNRPNLLFAN